MGSKMVICSKCDGSKVDADGNRCIDCNGLGSFPHWNDRKPSEIEVDIAMTEEVFRRDKQERDGHLLLLETMNENARWLAVQLADESMQYWTLRLEDLHRELTESRKRYGAMP